MFLNDVSVPVVMKDCGFLFLGRSEYALRYVKGVFVFESVV